MVPSPGKLEMLRLPGGRLLWLWIWLSMFCIFWLLPRLRAPAVPKVCWLGLEEVGSGRFAPGFVGFFLYFFRMERELGRVNLGYFICKLIGAFCYSCK